MSLFRSCKDEPDDDDDDDSMQVERNTRQETDNKPAAVESGRSKRLKNRKKRKTAEKDLPIANKPSSSSPLRNDTVESTCNEMDREYSSDSSMLSSTSSSSSSMSSSNYKSDDDRELTDDEVWLAKHTQPLGMPAWSAVKELCKRQYGCQSRYWQSKVSRYKISFLI